MSEHQTDAFKLKKIVVAGADSLQRLQLAFLLGPASSQFEVIVSLIVSFYKLQ